MPELIKACGLLIPQRNAIPTPGRASTRKITRNERSVNSKIGNVLSLVVFRFCIFLFLQKNFVIKLYHVLSKYANFINKILLYIAVIK